MSKKALKNLAALQPKEVPKKGDKKAMGALKKPEGKVASKKATRKPVVDPKDEIVELTSRREERVERKVCTSFREICRQGLFQNIMKIRWSYKRRYGAKFRKAIFGATVEFPAFKNIKISGCTEDYSFLVSRLNQYAQVEFRAHPFHWKAIAVVYGCGHSLKQLHCHEHDEHRVSGGVVLTGKEGDRRGGDFFVEKGRIIHHKGKAIPTMGTREDGSLVEGYLCDAQQHGVVFDSHALHGPWQWSGRRLALLFYTRALPEHMWEADVAQLQSLDFPLV